MWTKKSQRCLAFWYQSLYMTLGLMFLSSKFCKRKNLRYYSQKICQKPTDRWRCILYLGWSWNCAIVRNFCIVISRNFVQIFAKFLIAFTKLIIWINFVKFWLYHFTKFCGIKMLFRPILYFAKSRKPKEHDRGMRKMIITGAKAVRWLASMLSPFSGSLFVLKLLSDYWLCLPKHR
jgi:hypothetical protein